MIYQVRSTIFEYVQPMQGAGVLGGVAIGTALPVERLIAVSVNGQPQPDQYVVSNGRYYPLRINGHVYGVVS